MTTNYGGTTAPGVSGNIYNPFWIVADELGLSPTQTTLFFAGSESADWLTQRVTPPAGEKLEWLGFDPITQENEVETLTKFFGQEGATYLITTYNLVLDGNFAHCDRTKMLQNINVKQRVKQLNWVVPSWME